MSVSVLSRYPLGKLYIYIFFNMISSIIDIMNDSNVPKIDRLMEIVHEDMRTGGESGHFNDVHKFSVPGGSGSVGG